MAKIVPMRKKSKAESVAAYQRVYGDVERFIRMKLKWRGIHTLTYSLIADRLKGKTLLDIGCGFGRFSFLAARRARRVVGLDMTERALSVAAVLRESIGASNVEFVLSDIEGYDPGPARFNVIVLGGVLEHVIDPTPIFERIGKMLAKNGTLVINSPSEANFRGDVSTALLKLFDFPMSLSDVRQITPNYMKGLARKWGYRIERIVGCKYSRGWSEMGAKDLKERIANVLEDVQQETKGLTIHQEVFDQWVDERAEENRAFLDYLVRKRILKRIPKRPPFRLNPRVIEAHGLPLQAIQEYLGPDYSQDAHYTDLDPFNLMGGQAIYVLTRAR